MLAIGEQESERLTAGLKRRGIKPYAGFIYAAYHAYKHVVGAAPFSLVQQSSMQMRSYEPVAITT